MGSDVSTAAGRQQNEQLRKQVLDQVSKLPLKEKAFLRACSKADVVQIRSLIENNVNPNISGLTFCSPLHFVVCSSENPNPAEVVKVLLRHEIYPLSTAKNGATALHTVIANQVNDELALALVEALVYDPLSAKQILMMDNEGNNPLHLAAQLGRTQLVLSMLEKAKEFDCLNCIERTNLKGKTPLHLARSTMITEALLTYKPSCVNTQDKLGKTALHNAVSTKNLELTLLLLKYKAYPDIKDRSGFSPNSLANLPSAKNELDHIIENNLSLFGGRNHAQEEIQKQKQEIMELTKSNERQKDTEEQIKQLQERLEDLQVSFGQQMKLQQIQYEAKIKALEEKLSTQTDSMNDTQNKAANGLSPIQPKRN